MSGKIGSANFGALLLDGYDLLAQKAKAFTHKVTAVLENATGLGDSFENQLPTGVSQLEITQSGAFFDDSTTGLHGLLSTGANQQTARLVLAAFAGNTIGKPCLGASGVYGMGYEVLGQVAALTKANVTYKVSGTLDRGVLLNPSAAKVASWNTKTDGTQVDYTADTGQRVIPITSNTKANPSVISCPVPHGLTSGQVVLISGVTGSSPTINGQQTVTVISTTTFSVAVDTSAGSAGTGGSFVLASTVNGAVGYQMVSAMSGFTGFVGKIRHSADDTTYVDLITFSNVTAAPAAERVTTTGTINRYLAYTGTVTGSGSITVVVGCARS